VVAGLGRPAADVRVPALSERHSVHRKQALRSRGDDYRAYQRSTPMFFPWFPRSSKEHSA
jgi:steroid 5-alpha reductase family enzyme